MSLIYRLLGVVALLNQRLSRIRINFFPLNWAAMAGLAVLLMAALGSLSEAVTNDAKPRDVSVADVLAYRAGLGHNYVTVHGLLVPGAGYTQKDEGGGETIYVPMVDTRSRRAFLAELHGTSDKGDPREASVTGMLQAMDGDLTTRVGKDGGKIGGLPVDTENVLVEGEKPGSAAGWGAVAAASGVLLALFLITLIQRYVVFQKVGPRYAGLTMTAPSAPDDAVPGIELRATGEFSLDAQNARRFLNVPAIITTLENGEVAFVSNVDASSRFMGFTTQKRAGLWAAIITPGSLGAPEHGLLYLGAGAKPSLRVPYTDALTRRRESIILSFVNDGERASVLQYLESACRTAAAV